MKSKKAQKFIKSRICLTAQDIIQAVELAEKELKAKAIEAHRKSCFYLCTDNKCTSFVHNISILHTEYGKCNGDCIYMKDFKELLNK